LPIDWNSSIFRDQYFSKSNYALNFSQLKMKEIKIQTGFTAANMMKWNQCIKAKYL